MTNKLTDRMSWKEICEDHAKKMNMGQDFIDWMMTKEPLGHLFDYFMYAHAYQIEQKLKRDRDHVTVVCGKEGVGKSTFLAQINAVISPTFEMKNICFELSQFVQNLKSPAKGDSNQLDEGALFLFSYAAMSDESVIAKKLFTVIRTKNLHTGIAIPNFFTLDRYIRDHRVDTLIYVTGPGSYTAYTGKAIKIISKEGERFKTIEGLRLPSGTFWKGYFNKDIPTINDITPQTYREHKDANVNKFIADIENHVKAKDSSLYVSIAEATKIVPLGRDTLVKMLREGKLKGVNTGNKWLISIQSLENLANQGFSASSHTTRKDWGEDRPPFIQGQEEP